MYRPGDGIWVRHFGSHPAVVLRVLDSGSLEVLVGTSKERDIEHVCIRDRSPAATALGLNTDTFFYVTAVAVVSPSAVVRKTRRCPPGPFNELAVLANSAAKKD